ncbi:MAG: peptide chain release factor H [Chitinophagales bacterium]
MKKIVQITAGRGPVECMYVVSKILKLFLKACNNAKIEAQVTQRVCGSQTNTLVSAIVLVKGKGLDAFLDTWQGSVLWVCKSPYRKFHKRKNWFIEINTFEKSEQKALKLNEIEFKTTKASGPGGQHVNKTDSAVWATHKPSGIKVFVQDSRSQHQNKKLAIERLEKAFQNNVIETIQKENFDQWKSNTDIERGNPKRTFVGMNFKEK